MGFNKSQEIFIIMIKLKNILFEQLFHGKQGAGCIFLSKSTKRLLLSYRSIHVNEPNTWGVWGGKIDEDEDPEEAVEREIKEETGYTGELQLIPLSVFKDKKFRYFNYLAIVDEEFSPKLNWETEDFRWVNFGEWPSPLHFGLKYLINKDSNKIKYTINHL